MVSREAEREALTGEKAGWAIEPRNGAYFREPTLSKQCGRQQDGSRKRETTITLRGRRPRHAWKLYAREPGDPSGARRRSNRRAGGRTR